MFVYLYSFTPSLMNAIMQLIDMNFSNYIEIIKRCHCIIYFGIYETLKLRGFTF